MYIKYRADAYFWKLHKMQEALLMMSGKRKQFYWRWKLLKLCICWLTKTYFEIDLSKFEDEKDQEKEMKVAIIMMTHLVREETHLFF